MSKCLPSFPAELEELEPARTLSSLEKEPSKRMQRTLKIETAVANFEKPESDEKIRCFNR